MTGRTTAKAASGFWTGIGLLFGLGTGSAGAEVCQRLNLSDKALGEVTVARVVANDPRLHFRIGTADGKCPSADGRCLGKAFVVPGDEVLVVGPSGSSRCTGFKSTKGVETWGFLPEQALAIKPATATVPADWVGNWRRDSEASLTLTADGSRIEVAGEATWGTLDPARVQRGAVHLGELGGSAEAVVDRLFLSDKQPDEAEPASDQLPTFCAAELRLLGKRG